ncbi:MAG: hypothetical protein QXJ07_03620 [Candidatus Bathyarchaeia archaeon]
MAKWDRIKKNSQRQWQGVDVQVYYSEGWDKYKRVNVAHIILGASHIFGEGGHYNSQSQSRKHCNKKGRS